VCSENRMADQALPTSPHLIIPLLQPAIGYLCFITAI